MKKLLFFIIILSGLTFIFSCNNQNYNANPNSNANNSANPLSNSTYSWWGNGPISANINGASWVADAGSITFDTSNGYIMFSGNAGGKKRLAFWFQNVTAVNTYQMGWQNGSQYMSFSDSITEPSRSQYYSYLAPFGSGGAKILINNATTFQGLFYCEAIDSAGRVVNISNGYFNITKP